MNRVNISKNSMKMLTEHAIAYTIHEYLHYQVHVDA
jgi:arsenate reductase-like glutaredoxin family protein